MKPQLLTSRSLVLADFGVGEGAILLSLIGSENLNQRALGIDVVSTTTRTTTQNLRSEAPTKQQRTTKLWKACWSKISNSTFRMILSNPPYVTLRAYASFHVRRVLVSHEAPTPLVQKQFSYQEVIVCARANLASGGVTCLEQNHNYSCSNRKTMFNQRFVSLRTTRDLNKLPRLTTGTARSHRF